MARGAARRGPGPGRYLVAAAAGLGVAIAGGALLAVTPTPLLIILPLILTGFLVGQVMTTVAGGSAPTLAALAFLCGAGGPILGSAALLALASAGPSFSLRAREALDSTLHSLGPLGVVLLLMAGVIAAIRAR